MQQLIIIITIIIVIFMNIMLLLVDSNTNMTVSDGILEHSAMCLLMADETDAGMEALATCLAPQSGRRFSLAALDCLTSEWRAPL